MCKEDDLKPAPSGKTEYSAEQVAEWKEEMEEKGDRSSTFFHQDEETEGDDDE